MIFIFRAFMQYESSAAILQIDEARKSLNTCILVQVVLVWDVYVCCVSLVQCLLYHAPVPLNSVWNVCMLCVSRLMSLVPCACASKHCLGCLYVVCLSFNVSWTIRLCP